MEGGFADFVVAPLPFDEGVFAFADFADDFVVKADFADVDREVDLDLADDLAADLALPFDDADLARDHSFHCIADNESDRPFNILRMWCETSDPSSPWGRFRTGVT